MNENQTTQKIFDVKPQICRSYLLVAISSMLQYINIKYQSLHMIEDSEKLEAYNLFTKVMAL